jgi:ATP-binding cassette subfamily B protein
LTIPPGQKIGLIGYSGSGKSSIISLLLKYFSIQQGDILVDGTSIYSVNDDSVRSQISLIPQDIILFHRSIFENIQYGNPEATYEEVVAAAKAAHIHSFIETLPEKYQTAVGERGIKLSGGQRQRIAIARAMLKKAPILILDEATSALDTETESSIQNSLQSMLESHPATVIAVAHRLSTIQNMDRILVLEHGKIAEEGTFEELVRKEGGIFKNLWDNQSEGLVK